jgi:hypothetical protein
MEVTLGRLGWLWYTKNRMTERVTKNGEVRDISSTQEGVGLREPNQEHAMSGSDSIFTEADTIDELKANIMDALRCHFDQESDIPAIIHLHYVKDETLRYAPAS